jgi:hypothetical protein
MRVRSVFTGIALALASVHAQSARAAIDCKAFGPPAYQVCRAGLRSQVLPVTAADSEQHQSEWCWAASIAAVFAYYHHPVSQERIVDETYGDIVNLPGTPQAILSSLNRPWVDDDGRPFRVSGDVYSANPSTAANDLAYDRPLIIGTLGHAMVLTGVQFVRNPGGGRVVAAYVRDPWPFDARYRPLTAQEWSNAALLVRIRVF